MEVKHGPPLTAMELADLLSTTAIHWEMKGGSPGCSRPEQPACVPLQEARTDWLIAGAAGSRAKNLPSRN